MSAHTPGPWTNISDPAPNGRFGGMEPMALVSTHAGRTCIDCTGSGVDYAHDRANAILIAAAPDLLAELRNVLEWLDDGNRVLSGDCAADVARARDAIAKAEGRS
jgi:hypothetical protein